jgi:SAM-dependent methyltransferase
MAERTGLAPGKTIVDVGAGTGKLTRLLPQTGARVVAVEPLPEMRKKLVEVVPGVEALDGTAEELPLQDASADVIAAAQAFHWFDFDRALPELHRVLRPGGRLVLFWNNRDLDDPVQAGVEELLRPLRAEVTAQQLGAWRRPLEQSSYFGPAEERRFRYAQQFTTDELCDRVTSTSFVAAMPAVERDALIVRVRALTHGLTEPFPFPYRTEVHVLPRSSAGIPLSGDLAENGQGASIEG